MLTAGRIHDTTATHATILEAERDRLERRICWALRCKDAAAAERLGNQLERVERQLEAAPATSGRRAQRRHRYGPDLAAAMGW